jgi:hypothetical protein
MSVLNLDELASERDGGLYTPDDIRKLYEHGGIRLRHICKTPKSGRLRMCSNIIAALYTANVVRERGYIDAAFIISAIQQLQLPVQARLPLAVVDATIAKRERSA